MQDQLLRAGNNPSGLGPLTLITNKEKNAHTFLSIGLSGDIFSVEVLYFQMTLTCVNWKKAEEENLTIGLPI